MFACCQLAVVEDSLRKEIQVPNGDLKPSVDALEQLQSQNKKEESFPELEEVANLECPNRAFRLRLACV